ncbi:GntR family transcriptional regulator [Listeria floridensis FSL S10-1187]|uniref:GntR family transcriptional regulator n=1 Tax=Listeria floridensis FSL S10-1187 TaxID=1265817 RepID=A0ABN0RD29_9LIST|nr:GntR family transcriptional regulator [Listeria floridensis]EUJ28217.1 GntR family transcriptional regulator [Listeria floridensis FSL S10-1187]
MKSKRDYKTLDKVVYYSVIEKIKNGELKPNEHLTEERLSKELGVSRSPIRKAITALVAEGVLDYRTYSGVVVKDTLVDSTRYVQLLEVIELFVKAALEKLEQSEEEINIEEFEKCIQSMDRASYLRDLDEYIFNEHQFFLRLINYSGNPYYKEMTKKVFFNINYFSADPINQYSEEMRERNIKQLTHVVELLKDRRYSEASDEIKALLLNYGANAFR